MHKIVIFSCYFGKLPEHFAFFLKSAGCNSSIDFIIITDDKTEWHIPSNVRIINLTFEEMKQRLQGLFPDFAIVLDLPYKLCDYKPVWGLAFPDYLRGYDFWGHCDLDMLFGDIRKFVSDSILEKYDKIYRLGHLTLYRNTEENNNRYKLRARGAVYYRDAFSTAEGVAFDEIAGIQNIYDGNGIATYKARDYADITWGKYRFTLSDFLLSPEQVKDNNYARQVFYWEDGHVYRAFWADNAIQTDEFVYIHFSKRRMEPHNINADCSSFFITNRGLFPKQGEIQLSTFDQYNPYEPEQEKGAVKKCCGTNADAPWRIIGKLQKRSWVWDNRYTQVSGGVPVARGCGHCLTFFPI